MYQVNNFVFRKHLIKNIQRFIHNGVQGSSKALYPLESRKLLKISGEEVSQFLQGLITNDMRHLDETSKVIYTMFLNNKGRVLYDTLIYKWKDSNSFMIECDGSIMGSLQKHLKLYKLKRKLQLEDVNNDLKLWALTGLSDIVPKVDLTNISLYKDPRVSDLGYRVIAKASLEGQDIANVIAQDVTVENNEEKYKYLRYMLGVSEGATDLPPGSSFPLEANCDYLHGVSFHKGCYIGQELTARVHHTGVIRKRLMPLKFSEEVKDLALDSTITDAQNPKANLGKVKGYVQDRGLGLVRIKQALDAKQLMLQKYPIQVIKPEWWPIEARKEKLTPTKE